MMRRYRSCSAETILELVSLFRPLPLGTLLPPRENRVRLVLRQLTSLVSPSSPRRIASIRERLTCFFIGASNRALFLASDIGGKTIVDGEEGVLIKKGSLGDVDLLVVGESLDVLVSEREDSSFMIEMEFATEMEFVVDVRSLVEVTSPIVSKSLVEVMFSVDVMSLVVDETISVLST